ncbi:RecQ family ATP-dependent DNA helicase, partial [Rhodovulum sp.]|uniref:RecQ family ATP-dependent DNA helicase n=1 Tax=Rhodovulum sp. TaxID=34009 RepID=UPI0018303F2A
RTGESFGTQHLVDILTGTATDKIRARGHDRLPTFGVGREFDRRGWQAVFRQMMGRDLVRPDPDRHGALRMMDAARPILKGEAVIELRRDTIAAEKSRPVVKALVSDEDAPLLSALKAKRRALAEAAGVPAYIIFTDRTLIEMAETRPATLDEMARIGGVGATKLDRYGAAFLEVIAGAAERPHPARLRLAGCEAGEIFDRLMEVQRDLSRGADGTGKYLSCTHTTLRHIAERRPASIEDMARLPGMGPAKADRFGPAFLQVLAGE